MSPKSVKIGQKSGLFQSPSKTEIRSSFDENRVVRACQNLARLKLPKKLPKRAQLSPKSVKIGQKSGLFQSPSKTEIRSSFDENHVVKACQNLARLKLPKKLPKRAQLRPKSVKIGQKSGLFQSPSKTEIRSSFDENHVVEACQKLARLKLPKKLPKSVKIGQKSGFSFAAVKN